MRKIDIFNILFWIFVFLVIILLIWYIFGKSPGIESLIAALLASELALWKLTYNHGRELTKTRNTFGIIKKDMDMLKSDTNIIKKDLFLIKKKLKIE